LAVNLIPYLIKKSDEHFYWFCPLDDSPGNMLAFGYYPNLFVSALVAYPPSFSYRRPYNRLVVQSCNLNLAVSIQDVERSLMV
jgi:hypothetical protein